jgi:hypothetical protein
MGLAQQFERRLEALVEGVFTRGRSGLEPLEVARKLQREMGEHRAVGVHGEVLVPNHFVAALAPEDHARFAPVENALCAEIAVMLRSHANDEGFGLLGPVEVELLADPGVRRGRVSITSGYKEADGPTGGVLALADGMQVPLRDDITVIGRLPECDVTLDDPNVSRRHAEVRWDGRGYVVHDLGSMNGTLVNDVRVSDSRLETGDVVTIGRSRIEVRLA